ncbi:MAG: hypothetical protein PHR81_05980 [Bacteroidales bacterium]|jgi:ornithine decarboxylase|nr:hypothetical protein [Bacteroidales bacterium]MDD4214342.1 hypothetical protein [Bacteroidales bacterium]
MFDLSALPNELKKNLITFFKGDYKTPVVVSSKNQIKKNFGFFLKHFGFEAHHVFFPVKVNHHPDVLNSLNELNSSFEIASLGELEILKKIKINPEKIIFSNPVKIKEQIAEAVKYGIKTFAYDCESELKKIAEYAPGSNVYLRLSVSNTGAEWALSNKFGVLKKNAAELISLTKKYGLNACGIAFHVGWNNTRPDTFLKALIDVDKVLQEIISTDIKIGFINIGGGFPAHGLKQYEFLEAISSKIAPVIEKMKSKYAVTIYAEPGSFIIANCAVMVCLVIDVIKRGTRNWIFVDSGIFQGFQWIMGGLKYRVIYPYKQEKKTKLQSYTITGPSCDSHDIFTEELLLPDTIKSGDLLLIYPAEHILILQKNIMGLDILRC